MTNWQSSLTSWLPAEFKKNVINWNMFQFLKWDLMYWIAFGLAWTNPVFQCEHFCFNNSVWLSIKN